MGTFEDRSTYIFCDSVLQKTYYLLKNLTGNSCFNDFYVKFNLPQYILTATNLLEYKISIVAKKLDNSLFHFYTLHLFKL